MSNKKKLNKAQRTNGLVLQEITPKTENQELTFDAYEDGFNLLLHGVAGTGKTFISMYLALSDVLQGYGSCFDVKIIRSAVPTRNMGFLPGKPDEKLGVYEQPYEAICSELFGRGDAYRLLKNYGTIDFISTSHVRGTTFNDSIIIVDEVNNLTFHELDSVVTRIGRNCRAIFCGDFRQSDLRTKQEKQGLKNFMTILDQLRNFRHIEFDTDDIVRGELVKEYIIARERLGLSA